MSSHSSVVRIQTRGFSDMHDITPLAAEFLSSSTVQTGLFCAFVPGATAGITTIENEEGVLRDLREAIERMAPRDIHYEHDTRWGDGNGFSHVRAALLGPSLSVPVADGKLRLGTWQQIIHLECDVSPRRRTVMVTVMGE